MKWRSLHPEFTYRLWSLEDILALIDDDDAISVRARPAIQSLRFPAAQADVARLILLRVMGGFWVDLKLEPRIPFLTTLLDLDLVLIEHFPQFHRPEPNGFLASGFIGSDRYTPFVNHVLEKVITNVDKRVQSSIFDVTGPANILSTKVDMENNSQPIGNYTVLSHRHAWTKLFSMGPASYNNNGRHWSLRELREPIYVDNN
jgi:mannosyltransferase OCH1-like enzyme